MYHSSFHDEIRIVPYQEEWVQRFQAMKERITALLLKADVMCDVRHVGSTAVPGLCGKSIVDVLVTVDKADLEKAVSELSEEILCLGECGRPGRWFFSDGDTGHDAVYIHLTTSDNQSSRDQLTFLDMLLNHSNLRKQYAELKKQLAEQYPDDRTTYRLKKGMFIDKCLEEGYDMQGD